ncbi:MAG: heat shock protein Hsp20 [Rubrobacteraceae bacterium]|jgi:HSP20 family protein|nr:heat shock protein Hsp20 [Rubrobacteraceae bacterium]
MLSPFRRFWDMQSEINRMVAEAFRGMPQIPATEAGWTPTVDVVTKDEDMVIRAELPGMKREDVNISFQNGVLTISGERKEEEERKEANYLVKERRYGSFSRSMTLPEGIDEDRIKATFKDGVLEVTVEGAGTQVEAGPRRIEIED